jgi:glycosyltransferase involved in cell wall biosynthesis
MNSTSELDPKLSIVIAASNSVDCLEHCLSSLRRQAEAPDIEVIVATNYAQEITDGIKNNYPFPQYIYLAKNTTVPELRTTGIAHSKGEIVALLEDHCVIHKNWCREIKRAHQLPYAMIGGSVENATSKSLLDWAVYFFDYGKYMLPDKSRLIDTLPGNNVSYKKSILRKIENNYRNGFFETFVNLELEKQGHFHYFVPSAIVYHRKSYSLGKTFLQHYYHGRSFGGMRLSDVALPKRIIFLFGSFFLPVLLPLRIVLRTFGKGRHIKKLLFCLPYLFLLITSWSFGELCGYLFGEGNSHERWT